MQATMYRKTFSVTLFLLFVLVAFGEVSAARAQGIPAATKRADLSVFGAYTRSAPDYGAERNNGGVIGGDYTRYLGWRIAPSFEVRAHYTSGYEVTQESILAGLRLKSDIRRFHPYADILYGGTKIIFKFPITPTYTQDTATALSLGGGLDFDLVHHFQLKVDYQQQLENFGPNGLQPNNGDFTLSPSLFSVGVVYRIPIRDHKRQSDKAERKTDR